MWEIGRDAGLAVPILFRIMIAMMNILKERGILILGPIVLMPILVEWRSGKWPRYLRTSSGVGSFLVNSAILVLITAMFTVAMMAAPALLHAR